MKKRFKCPICGNHTISFREKMIMNARFKGQVTCANCNNKLTTSKIDSAFSIASAILLYLVYRVNVNLIIKIVLVLIILAIQMFGWTYIVSIVKYEES